MRKQKLKRLICRAENEEGGRDCRVENVNVCERERSDVEKISKGFMKLVVVVVEFGDMMAELGSKQVGKDIMKKRFCKMSDILCATSSSQLAPQEESLLDDDSIFNDENFLAAVAALEYAFTKTFNAYPISSPNWDLLTPTPNTQPDQEKAVLDKEMLSKYKSYYIARDQFLTLRNGKMEKAIVDVWSLRMNLKNIIQDLFPGVQHINCARHVNANWSKSHRGKVLEGNFWQTAKTPNEAQLAKIRRL